MDEQADEFIDVCICYLCGTESDINDVEIDEAVGFWSCPHCDALNGAE